MNEFLSYKHPYYDGNGKDLDERQILEMQKEDSIVGENERKALKENEKFVLDEMLGKHYLIKAKAAWPSSKRTSLILSATLAIPFLR